MTALQPAPVLRMSDLRFRWPGTAHDVLDMPVTPDMGHCLSVRGLAREASQALGVGYRDVIAHATPARRLPDRHHLVARGDHRHARPGEDRHALDPAHAYAVGLQLNPGAECAKARTSP